jgi:hypothetical protein
MHAEALSKASPEGLAPFEAELRARLHVEAEANEEAARAEAEMTEILREEADAEASDAREALELRQEIAAEEAKKKKALAEAAELSSDASLAVEASAASSVLKEAEEAEALGEQLEEDQMRLKEELGSLRFSLKENKRFQHKRVQELIAQAQKLERQKQKLEEQAEQAARARSDGASEGQQARLQQLQQLDERLKVQVRQAIEERDQKLADRKPLEEHLASLREQVAQESKQVEQGQERLDECAQFDGEEQREIWKLQARANLLSQQVDALEQTSSQTRLQFEEAEQTLGRHREEEASAERRAEIMKWKLQVAETQLQNAGVRRGPRTSGRGTGAASDSSTGHGPGAHGDVGDESPTLRRTRH